jgi:SAM-dependent methyltransferase
MASMVVDFGRTATDYRRHRAGFPAEFFQELRQRAGVGIEGQSILDVGTGTGSVARGLALQGAAVVAVDIAQPLMDEAAALDQQAGVAIQYHGGKAEALPFGDEQFDAVTAGQCWHWFDREAAAREALRVLRPGGLLVIAHFDWLPIRGTAVAETEQLILQHNPLWKMAGATGFYPHWCESLVVTGFDDLRSWSFDTAISYSHERWRGRIRASAGIAASLSAAAVVRFDEALALLLANEFPEEPMQLLHRVWTLVCRKPGSSR